MMNQKRKTTDPGKISFGAFIKKHRKLKGYTQKTLSEKWDKTTKAISEIENGHCYPTQEDIFKVAQILDMSLDEYVFGVSRYDPTISISEINEMLQKLSAEDQARALVMLKNIFSHFEEKNH